jgi:hypothetical protein
MATHDLTVPLLGGNGVPTSEFDPVLTGTVQKAAVRIGPDYDFQREDLATNWAVMRPFMTSGESVNIPGLESVDSNGDPVVWRIITDFLDRANGLTGRHESKLFTIPADAPTSLNYPNDIQFTEESPRPDYVQAALDVAEGFAEDAAASAAAALAVGTTNDTIIAGRINTPGSATATALTNTIAAAVGSSKKGQAWFDKTLGAPIGNDLPTVTLSAAPTLAGTLFTPKRVNDVATGPLDLALDAHFRYDGGPGGDNVNASYVKPQVWVTGTWDLHAETVTGRQTDVEFKVRSTTTTLAFRIEVNGHPLTVRLDKRTVTANQDMYVRLTFPTAAVRTVKFMCGPNLQFGGAIAPTAGTLSRPTAAIKRRGAVNADSFGDGALDSMRGETFAYYICKMLECDSIINVSRGGMGLVDDAGDTDSPFSDRVPAMLAMQPHVVLIVGSRNDSDHTTDEVYEAAKNTYGLVTNVPVVITAGPAQSSFAVQNTGVRDGAAAAGVTFVDVLGSVTGATTGNDGVHPTPQGHIDMSISLNDGIDHAAVDAAVAAFAQIEPTVTLTASANPTIAGANVTLTATTSPPVTSGRFGSVTAPPCSERRT